MVVSCNRPNGRRPNSRRPNSIRPNSKSPNSKRPNSRCPNSTRPNSRRPNSRRPNSRRPSENARAHHATKGPKTVRNGPREHVGAISLLPIFVHPADSPETHANKGAFQKLGFSCSRSARSGFSQAPTRTKQLRKNENSTTDFPQLF